MCFDFGEVSIMHHRLASNLVRCGLVLCVDSEIVFCCFPLFVHMIL